MIYLIRHGQTEMTLDETRALDTPRGVAFRLAEGGVERFAGDALSSEAPAR